MKKNLITVIILAICIINLVFNILIVFVFMPSMQKTNNLITSISKILDIEVSSINKEDESGVGIDDLTVFPIEDENAINLKDDGSGKTHYLKISISLNLNKSAKDYEATKKNLESGNAMILDCIRNVVAKYTFSEVTDVTIQNEIKAELLSQLKEIFQTEAIYSVSFSNFIAQ